MGQVVAGQVVAGKVVAGQNAVVPKNFDSKIIGNPFQSAQRRM
jgi:hypothetical protein